MTPGDTSVKNGGMALQKPQIVNIVNFIRGYDPRTSDDLAEPVRRQLSLLERHQLKGTFLLQYDALLGTAFTNPLQAADPNRIEIGVWFEIVQPLAEKAGIPWTGRYAWDWHARHAFSAGYTPKERERMVDVLFEDFKAVFGFYPKSFGSWVFDAHTLAYASGKYGLDAACNCKDQWGTDGYTLWGGYYGQGYYPSRCNVFCPAQKREEQIDVPVFRMLGSDPVAQYDLGVAENLENSVAVQGVVTLEPVYCGEAGGGGVPAWTDWYFAQNFSGNCLTFGYTQAGQENSFGWPAMAAGLSDQLEKIAEWQKNGRLSAETLGEAGRWYKQTFSATPPSTIVAETDWKNTGKQSVWFNCRRYRINLYAEGGRFWIRDLHLFDGGYAERYLDAVCDSDKITYDNLPVADGSRFSGHGVRGGLYPSAAQGEDGGLPYTEMQYAEAGGTAVVTFSGTPCGEVVFTLTEEGASITKTGAAPLYLTLRGDRTADGFPDIHIEGADTLCYTYRTYPYLVRFAGAFAETVTDHTGETFTLCCPGETKILFPAKISSKKEETTQ